MSEKTPLGFVGLGNMGGPMCANLAKAGWPLLVYDKAGSAERAPEGTDPVESLAELVQRVDTVLLSLPDGPVVRVVAEEIAAAPDRRTKTIVDLSTVGVQAAVETADFLAGHGITYIDAPVSGGRAGAIAATISVMCAGPAATVAALRPALEVIGGNVFQVGERAGQGQAMKLANNFLSAVAMAATSEAVHFGQTQGLDISTMLDVLNVSSGRNTASSDKFPNRIATGTYDAGFATALMAKDVALYLENVRRTATPDDIGAVVAMLWREADGALPGSDFTRIYDFIAGRG